MKAFVIGANSFLGQTLVRDLLHHGHQVYAPVENLSKLERPWISIDWVKPESYVEYVRDSDVIYDLTLHTLSGIMRFWTIKNIQQRRLYHLDKLLSVLPTEKIKAYIYCSSVLAFGNHSYRWVDEKTTLNPIGYARVEAPVYAILERYAALYDFPLVTAFPGWVYGGGGWFLDLIRKIRINQCPIYGTLQNYWSLIHVQDAADLLMHLGEFFPVGEKVILADYEPVLLGTLIKFLTGCFKKQLDVPALGWWHKFYFSNVQLQSLNSSVRAKNTKMLHLLGGQLEHPDFKEGIAYTLSRIAEKEMVW